MVIQIPDIALNPDAWSYDIFAMLALVLILAFYLLRKASGQGVDAWRAARQDRQDEVERLREQNEKLRKKITEYQKDYVRILKKQKGSD